MQLWTRHQEDAGNTTQELLSELLYTPASGTSNRLRPVELRSVDLQRRSTLAPYPQRTWVDTALYIAERLLGVAALLFWVYWMADGWGRDLVHAWTSPPPPVAMRAAQGRPVAPTVAASAGQSPPVAAAAAAAPPDARFPDLGTSLPVIDEPWRRPAQPLDYLVPARSYVAALPARKPEAAPATALAAAGEVPASPADLRPTHVVAPAIGLESPVVEVFLVSGRWQIADYAVGYHNGTGVAGSGNVVLAGHKGLRGAVFKDLERLRIGDEVRIEAGGGSFVYRVTTTGRVWPSQVEVMYPTKRPVLTMITCTNWDLQRFVVIAELVESPPVQPAGGS